MGEILKQPTEWYFFSCWRVNISITCRKNQLRYARNNIQSCFSNGWLEQQIYKYHSQYKLQQATISIQKLKATPSFLHFTFLGLPKECNSHLQYFDAVHANVSDRAGSMGRHVLPLAGINNQSSSISL